MMHQERVEKHHWISEHRYLHGLNSCMLLPGPEAILLTIYVSSLMHGLKGAVMAGELFFLPAFLLLSALAGVFFAWHTFWPQATSGAPFAGSFEALQLGGAIAAFVALWKLKADIMKVIGVCALLGLAYSLAR